MHELVPAAAMDGEVRLDGTDIYGNEMRAQEVRTRIGMVFQKPNPFPAMSVKDNVLSGLKLARIGCSDKDALVEVSLERAGLWREVRDRLDQPGGALSGGQQQRLCIARSLAVAPNVLLMDEPCSALDPTSTRRIEETIDELRDLVTVVIVTHNMQQAHRVSDFCAFFLAEENEPGYVVEQGPDHQDVRVARRPPDPRLRGRAVRMRRVRRRARFGPAALAALVVLGLGAQVAGRPGRRRHIATSTGRAPPTPHWPSSSGPRPSSSRA